MTKKLLQIFFAATILLFIIAAPALCISITASNDVGSVSSNYYGGKTDTISENIALGSATLADTWYYNRNGYMPTTDKWYYSKNGKHSVHNYATGYGYPIVFSGNAYIDTASVEVSNRCYLTGGGSTKPAYLKAYLDAYANGYRTTERLAAESYLELTQYTGTATIKNYALSNTDTTVSPLAAKVYVSQSISNVNGNLYTKNWAQSYPSYDFAATYTTAKGAKSLSESSSANGWEATAQEWALGGTHRLEASSKLSGIADNAVIDSKSFYKRNEYVNFYMTKSHAEWQLAPSIAGSLTASATSRNVKSTYANARSDAIMRTDSDKALAWTRTMSGYSSIIGNTDNLDNSNYWKSGQWVTALERTTSGDVSSNYASLSSEIRGTSCTSSALTNINAKGVDIISWKWNPSIKTWVQLANQYGMNKYYTSDLNRYVNWQFDGNGKLITKAGDLNGNGIVPYDEIIYTIGTLYPKGEVTLPYAKAAIANWQTSP
jgi:hypothetical protein